MTKLEQYLTDFVKEFNEEFVVTFNEIEGNAYYTAESRINLVVNDFDDCGFMRHLKEFHNCDWADEFGLPLWAILHEIGHWDNEGFIENSEEEDNLIFWLSLTSQKFAHDTEIQNKYFNITEEFYATEWAKDWIEENWDRAKEIAQKIEELM